MNKKLKEILLVIKVLAVLYAVYLAVGWVFMTFLQPSNPAEAEWMTYVVVLVIFLAGIWRQITRRPPNL